jgi:hypothetical protein
MSQARKGLNFFFGRSYNHKLLYKNIKTDININNTNTYMDSFYDFNKIIFYNKLKVLKYKVTSYKYKIKFKRHNFVHKIKGISNFKSFLNNVLKMGNIYSKNRRIKIKKRMKIMKKGIPFGFFSFFKFIFFFYLNKFNVIIDSYNKKKNNFYYLIKINKNYKKRYNYRRKHKNTIKYNYTYIFRYKSKKIYKRKKNKKHGYIYDNINLNHINGIMLNTNFLLFYWKHFIIFLGLKLRNKFYKKNINNKLKKK